MLILASLELVQRPIRVYQYFRIPFYPLIKLLVGHGRIVNIDFMGYYKARFRLTRDYQIPQIPVVGFHVALARS